LYSTVGDSSTVKTNILIIDQIGLLSRLYRYADVAVVGGGFDEGVHNVLEAAVFNIPIVSGANITKDAAAIALKQEGFLKVVKDEESMKSTIDQLSNENHFSSEISKWMLERTGAVEQTYKIISPHFS